MPITLNHSNIGVQYSTGSNYIIETVKSDLYRRNEIVDPIVRDNIQTAPVIPTTYVDSSGNVYAVESYTYSGSANTADFTRVFTKSTTCDILIVGGGGGGGYHTGGGGGAGGYYYQKNVSIPVGNYTINVGKGGNAGPDNNTRGGNGSDTIFNGITAKGGGGGASDNAPSGNSGGSGGGADWNGTAGLDTDTNTEGNNGGTPINITGQYYGSGGGGAGSTGFTNGNGGVGKSNSITGANTFYAAGGGGGRNQGTNWRGIGGSGIGGNGGNETTAGTAGLNGTGSGGGGGGFITGGSAGSGGSGIVIIRYLLGTIPATNLLTNEPVVIAQTFTESIRSFTHSGGSENQTSHTITIGQNTICDILIVGGGGAGANFGGGGGAGQVLYTTNFTIGASSSISIKVGRGGIITQPLTVAENGFSSSITIGNITYTANGGGGGGGRDRSGYNSFRPIGGIGGSGGGGQAPDDGAGGPGGTTNKTTYPDWISNGNDGGNGVASHFGGGGGGAGAIGGDGVNGTSGGSGGTGVDLASIFTTTFGANGWFGGGGGGVAYGNGPGGAGGTGGGGAGARWSSPNIAIGVNGTANTGGGGGSSGLYSNYSYGTGGSGGSGIVLIKFKSIINAAILDGITHKRLNFGYNNDNLVAWYKFNGDYFDSSGNGHNLTNVGTVIQSTHIIEGQAVEFDSTDYLEFPATINPYTIWNGKGITFSCWVRFTAHETNAVLMEFQQTLSNSAGLLIGFKTTTGGNKALIIIVNTITVFNWSDWNNPLIATLNVWRHLVFCVDVAGKWDVYLDNVRINGTETANIPNITYNFRFINRTVWNSTVMWDGQMDDFRIYDRALSAADVTRLYNKTYPAPSNTYTLNFPVPTIADINNNSNIVLRGAYDIALSTTNAAIIPKTGQYIPKPTTFTNYSVERMYPPVRNFTAATTLVSGQTYGNGTYVVSFSPTTGGSLEPWTCFNTGVTSGGAWADGRYTAGTFNSTSFIVAGYLGDWVKIQLPVAIKLTRFEFLMRNEGYQILRDRAPKDFKIYGSNDNITWVELVNKTDAVYNASFKYEQTTPEITNTYTYYGLVVNKLLGSTSTILNFDEWYIYGNEVLTSSLSLRYNLLNPTLDPVGAQWTYSSSNMNVYHMGSVGVGTTNPEYHLDVSGSLNAKTLMYNGSSINSLGLSVGMIAQVQHLTYTKMEVKDNTGWDAINEDLTSGFVIKITPKSSLSKMLVNLIVFIGMSTSSDNAWWGIKLYRKIGTGSWTEITGCNGTETGSAAATAGTPVWISNNAGMITYNSSITNASGTYLDSPNTTATVYYTAYWNQRLGDNPSVTGQMFLNRASNHDDAHRPAPSSSWTVEEIWYG